MPRKSKKQEQREFRFEVALSVSDYVKKGHTPVAEAFDACEADCESAIKEAKYELTQAEVSQEIQDALCFTAVFLEFDSPNWTHAGGIFEVCVVGKTADVEEAERRWTLWFNS